MTGICLAIFAFLQVISTNPRFCKVAILGVESTSLKETFKGTIRKEDVRATEKDKVEMYKSFRPGDIVLARVLTLHTQTYLLSTAKNELGVIFAKSEAGKRLNVLGQVGQSMVSA